MQKNLGAIIKEYREENGLSLEDFSKRVGMSKGYLSMLESGNFPEGRNKAPRLDTVYRISRAMSTDFEELLYRLGPDQQIIVNGRKIKSAQEILEEEGNRVRWIMDHHEDIREEKTDPITEEKADDPYLVSVKAMFSACPKRSQNLILEYFDLEIARRKLEKK